MMPDGAEGTSSRLTFIAENDTTPAWVSAWSGAPYPGLQNGCEHRIARPVGPIVWWSSVKRPCRTFLSLFLLALTSRGLL